MGLHAGGEEIESWLFLSTFFLPLVVVPGPLSKDLGFFFVPNVFWAGFQPVFNDEFGGCVRDPAARYVAVSK